MRHPTQVSWNERSDTKYDVEHLNHPRGLAVNKLVSRPVYSKDAKCASNGSGSKGAKESNTRGPLSKPSKRTELFQRIRDRNRRYKLLN